MARVRNKATVPGAAVVIPPQKLDAQKHSAIAIQTGHTNGADAVVVLEGSVDDGTTFFILAAIDPTDAASIKLSFTGIDKAGVVPLNARGLTHVQVRRTDANITECFVSLGITTD